MTIEATPLICFQGSLGCFQTAFSKMHKAADRLFTQTMRLGEQLARGGDDADICRGPERWKRRIEAPLSVVIISRGQSEEGSS